ncbi:hypothetical protein BU17DRAFT_99657 [Hysterangium stoloniferum]|nr:hypothetical protein BU17DRAFT_99657 [Hysterangium stoloniferum]
MDDSDEYFDDSFTLDDEALASIQETEERFTASVSQTQVPPPQLVVPHPLLIPQPPQPLSRNCEALPNAPPSKRLKTSHGEAESRPKPLANDVTMRTAPTKLRRMESMGYDLDIRVGPDGKYVMATHEADKEMGTNPKSVSGPSTLSVQERQDHPVDHDQSNIGSSSSSVSHIHGVVSQLPLVPAATQRPLNVPPSVQQTTSSTRLFLKSRSGSIELARPSNSTLVSQEVVRPVPPPVATRRQLVRRATTAAPSEHSDEPTASQRRTRLIEQALSDNLTQTERSTSIPSVKNNMPPVQSGAADFQDELASLRAELEKVKVVNINIQKSLREAQEAQVVKAGEVTILRQTIEKTKKEHAEAAAKARANILACEKVKADLESKLKEEAERMATRLIFKQHEMETSTRKPAWGSVRSKRVAKDSSAFNIAASETPTRTRLPFPPSTMKRNSRPLLAKKDQQNQVVEEGGGPMSSPTSDRRSRARDESRNLRFKGFHNAFTDTQPVVESPTRAKKRNTEDNCISNPFYMPAGGMDNDQDQDVYWPMADKGKGKAVEVDFDMNMSQNGHNRNSAPHSSPAKDMVDKDVAESGGIYMESNERADDEEMLEEGIDWGEELRRLVFTHTAPLQRVLTLQMLFSTALPSETSFQARQAYTAACQTILEMCGANHGHTYHIEDSEWEEEVVDKVANAFVTIADILCSAGCIPPLLALLDLLTLLTLCIPTFLSPFLGAATANDILDRPLNPEGPSQLLAVLCNVVQMHLVSGKDNVPGELEKTDLQRNLATTVVELMESLCWNVKDGLIEQLGIISRPAILDVLLHPGQSVELLGRTLRLLILLASHRVLFRYLLASDDANSIESIALNIDNTLRIPLIEKLCHFLVEPIGEEVHKTHLLVFTLIKLLADSHSDAHTLLLESISLAPSLVVCITKLSRLLWEDDPAVMGSTDFAKTTVEMLFIAVNLLHHLLFTLELSSILGRKLVEASRLSGPFNGVTHMFIVTFGRLSWAEAPEWLESECKSECEVVAELALEIIETVVAGPECDSLWAVWHQNEIIDEEEVEAQRIMVD